MITCEKSLIIILQFLFVFSPKHVSKCPLMLLGRIISSLLHYFYVCLFPFHYFFIYSIYFYFFLLLSLLNFLKWYKLTCPAESSIPSSPSVTVLPSGQKNHRFKDIVHQTWCVFKTAVWTFEIGLSLNSCICEAAAEPDEGPLTFDVPKGLKEAWRAA